MIGDRPHANAAAPEEYIFVCKLNPVTTEEDLETIFCRFGEVVACDIIRDKKTGDSLNYAFIGFSEKKAAEEAYLKMNNALIDDRCVARVNASGLLVWCCHPRRGRGEQTE
jgi:peptidyl-prolyl cis-trans isomerase-like 4